MGTVVARLAKPYQVGKVVRPATAPEHDVVDVVRPFPAWAQRLAINLYVFLGVAHLNSVIGFSNPSGPILLFSTLHIEPLAVFLSCNRSDAPCFMAWPPGVT